MARSIGMAADATVFRAVITMQNRDGETTTTYEGPYGSIGAARGRVSFWVNYLADRDPVTCQPTGTSRVSGYVERGTVAWQRVEESGQ
ncbi:hypothetical protein ABZ419_11305 [Streptomyces cinnamoneus]|uniref:hypothetical protein n=1 Tax=Streptomyces cinnamoneus TaxID=53446 RepID=UPI0033F143A9